MLSRLYFALSTRVRQFRAKVLVPERWRNPWLRCACRLLGIALLAGMLGIGMILYACLVTMVWLRGLFASGAPPATSRNGRIIDGQSRVVKPTSAPPITRKTF